MTQRWAFRVASTPSVGAGHVSRCMALASAMQSSVVFYLDPDGMNDSGVPSNIVVKRETGPGRCDVLLEAVHAGAHDAVLFDGYDFGETPANAAAARVFTARFLDTDRPDAGHLDIRIGLDSGRTGGSSARHVLAGPQYVPLHPAFAAVRVRAEGRRHPDVARRVLVGMGGRDSRDLTGLVLAALKGSGLVITVVLSDSALHRDKVRAAARDVNAELCPAPSPEAMAEFYLSHDFAIGMAGISMFERMACGLPSILVGLSDSQMAQLSAAVRAADAVVVDQGKMPLPSAIRAAALALAKGHAARETMSDKGLRLIDGQGASRLARALEAAAGHRP